MDFWTFLSSIVKSLAWPCLIAAILYYGRTDIFKLIRTIKSIKYDKLELMFEERAAQTAEDAENISGGNFDYTEKYKDFVFLSPYETVMKSYMKLEETLRDTIDRKIRQGQIDINDIYSKKTTPLDMLPAVIAVKLLLAKGFIDMEFVNVHENLKRLRNMAAHKLSFEISNDAAKNFADSTIALIDKLNTL